MRAFLLLGCVACLGCATAGERFGDGGGGDGGVADAAPPFGDGAPAFADVSATDAGEACSQAATLVYAIATDGVLRSFNPATLAFTTIGPLGCNTSALPNSMAVDRTATAWVNMADGSLWKVSTRDASCEATSYQLGQLDRRIRGMGFATDSAQATAESLYACTTDYVKHTGGGLAKINLPSLTLTLVGDYTNGLGGSECELTGTGDARLFGFFATLSPPKLAEIDERTAATPSPITLGGVDTTLSYAFSFWGGDFWFYTQGSGVGSTVTHYKYATDRSYETAIQDTGFTIVGAGVSTCAPLTPPK